jgi:glyoxylase-like metal-dependent hydrolase (beta-lactamase superfamily II)
MAEQISRPTLDRLFDAARGSGRLQPTDQAGGVNVTRRLLLAASCLCTACFMPASSFAAVPMVKRQAPAFYRLMLGDFEVTVLSDGSNMLPATKLLHGDAAQIEAALQRGYLADVVETSHNSFLVNTRSKLVLIDAGAGSLLGPGAGHLVSNLRAAGYQPEQVDEVYLTHLHADHIGGLMTGQELTFPNAVVRVNRRDTDYWLSESNMQAAPADAKRFFQAAIASLTPYMRASKLVPFDGDTDLVTGVRSRAAYGHTPGHTMYMVESKGQRLLLWGDIVHVAAVQFDSPAVTIGYDVDVADAEREHWRQFADAADKGYLIGGAHISFPGLGRVRRDGERTYTYVPLNYSTGMG